MSILKKTVNSILKKLKRGDETQIAALYNATYVHLRAVILRELQNKDDVSDVLEEVYTRALQSIQRFDIKQDGYNWLYTIAVHRARDYNIRGCKEQNTMREVAATVLTAPDPFEAADTRMHVQGVLKTLGKDDYNLLYRIYYEGATMRDVAKELGVSVSTVSERHEKILKKLRKKFEEK